MSIKLRNLSGDLQSAVLGNYPDIGQLFYVVDSNYRTAAQGWSNGERTGPLDLWSERNKGHVYRSGDYSSDSVAIQAAIDAMVDYRGDALNLTAGSYSLAAALAFNVENGRLLGPPVPSPWRSAVTVTDAIGDGIAVSGDNVEIAFLRFVPLTATNIIQIANGSDAGWLHHCLYNTTGVDASTSTEFVQSAATTVGWVVQDMIHLINGLQGDCYTLTTAKYWEWDRVKFITETASYASVFTLATSCVGNELKEAVFIGDADGTYTNIVTGATNENQQLIVTGPVVFSGTALATASNFETGFGTTTDIEIARVWQTGDASGEGGLEVSLA